MAKTIQIPSGATLSGLAKQYGTSVDELLRLNPSIKDPNKISVGANLVVPDTSPLLKTETPSWLQPTSQYQGKMGTWMLPGQPNTGYSGLWKTGYVPSTVGGTIGGKVEAPVKTEAQKLQEQIEATKTQIASTQSVLDQATKLGYKAGDTILYDPNTNTVVAPGSTGGNYEVPDWLTSNEYFKQLSPDDQKFLVNYYNILKVNDTEKQTILKQAFIDAAAAADPYFKEKIRIATDELSRALGEQKGDIESKQRDLTQKIQDIKDDLATGSGRLSVDEQAELGRRQRQYEYDLENLRETAATAGLTFSSKRALAEGRLATEQTDIVESTKRSFQRQIEDLQTKATRGDRDAQNLLADYERIYGENVTKLVRGAETTLGTTGLPSDLAGVKPLGGVTGSLEEEKLKDIATRAEALVNLRNPFL